MNDTVSVSDLPLAPLPYTPGGEWGTQSQLFDVIFWVFLVLGTIVGVVVISYTLYNAYKYRDRGEEIDEADRPVLGELPTGEGGGKKLFLSFFLSAVIVISLVVWTYGALLYVEAGPEEQGTDENLDVDVIGFQFGWTFEYENGYEADNELRVPADRQFGGTLSTFSLVSMSSPSLRSSSGSLSDPSSRGGGGSVNPSSWVRLNVGCSASPSEGNQRSVLRRLL